MSYLTNGQSSVVIGNGSAVVDDCELRAKPVIEPTPVNEIIAPATLAQRIQTALGDHRRDQAALDRVLGIVAFKNVVPTELLEKKVREEIERRLVQQVAFIVGGKLRDMQRVKPA